MMNKLVKMVITIVFGLMISGSWGQSAFAASLWSDQSAGMFSDLKARNVGDILTIIINETSNASRSGNASNSKSSKANADAGLGVFKFIGNASVGSNDSFKAQGAINNSNRVTGKLTVRVVEVSDNGNLHVEGTQSIKQNGEEQRLTITGVVRPYDIASDNTILSNYVADAEIRIDGKGPIARKQRQGILTQIFNILF